LGPLLGKDNILADTLSRFSPEMGSIPGRDPNTPIVGATGHAGNEFISAVFASSGLGDLQGHFQNLRELQVDDPFLGPIFDARVRGVELLTDGTPKITLPEYLAGDVFRGFHEQYGHFGITKVYSLMNRHFFLRKMRARIERFIKSCDVQEI
jgi:hypothetical protein